MKLFGFGIVELVVVAIVAAGSLAFIVGCKAAEVIVYYLAGRFIVNYFGW